jgi:hypothetical protein
LISLLRKGMVATSCEPLDFVLCIFFLCSEAFLRDLMKSNLHTTNMHIPTLVYVIWISNVEVHYTAVIL